MWTDNPFLNCFIILLLSVAFVILVPTFVYLCVKLGTLGYFNGKRLSEENAKKEKDRGKDQASA